jgi:hypothetical protein
MPNAFSKRWSQYQAPTAPRQRDDSARKAAQERAEMYRTLGLVAPIAGTALGAAAGGGLGFLAGGGLGAGVGAIPGALTGAAAGGSIGMALGNAGGSALGAMADRETQPDEEAEMKREAQRRAYMQLLGGYR